MKKAILILSLVSVGIIMGSCKKSSGTSDTHIPFQGPQNPNFATDSYWEAAPGLGNEGYFSYAGGTGFLPTYVTQYGLLTNWIGSLYSELNSGVYFYQDGVDFSHSTSMTFDYQLFAAAVPVVTSNDSFPDSPSFTDATPAVSLTATAEILFTDTNGTITLWQTTLSTATNGTTATAQGLNVTISLPSLPSPGRLIIEIIPVSATQFGIANIRVQ